MLTIQPGAAGAVAADTKRAVTAIDAALLCDTQLMVTIIEALQESDLPIKRSQDLLQSMTTGINHVMAGRAAMVGTIAKLTAIKGQSNIAPVSYGCPAGLGFMESQTTEIASVETVPA
jgi:hypothetical protein